MKAFPNAKVILTLRDPEKWYDSVSNTIGLIRKRMTPVMKAFQFLNTRPEYFLKSEDTQDSDLL